MALPHQVPLYRALDAVDSHDFDAAEEAVSEFFKALENDPIAKDCRRQHFERQVFEADFLSILIKEEIDAWGVLATVKLSRDDIEGARSACFRMIELIDQYYGFDTPSWDSPEARIPINPELMSRYFQIASLLTVIYEQKDELEMSKRWANVRKTAVSDIQQPEVVWGRWISEEDASLSVGITIYELSDWQIERRSSDGREWLANIYRSLTERISPHEMNWLVAIHIPTDLTCDVPTKSMRWKIWSLRLAIAGRLHRAKAGAYFGELQTRGERILLYYASSEQEARDAIGHILEDANELKPSLEIRHDVGWTEYSKWAESSIIVDSPLAVPMPDAVEGEHENNQLLRTLWESCESVHSANIRLSQLLAGMCKVPPQGAEFASFCIDYVFALAALTENKAGYIQLAADLAKVDKEAAIRAFDMFWNDDYPIDHENQYALCNLAESIADIAPLKALQVERAIRRSNYSLVHETTAKIAKVFHKSDPNKAMQLIQEARKVIVESDGREFEKSNSLSKLAVEVADFFPEFAREMLIEAEAYTSEITESDTKAQAYSHIVALTEKIAADKLPEFCNRAIENALRLETEDPGFWGFGGVRSAIASQLWLIRCAAKYDKKAALELSTHTLEVMENTNKDGFDFLLSLSLLAEAIVFIGDPDNRELAETIWSKLKESMNVVSSADSYFLNKRFEQISRSPMVPLVKMNPVLAADKLTAIISICKSAGLPEVEITLLCTFAVELYATSRKKALELLSIADETVPLCSSEHLRTDSRMLIIAIKESLEIEIDKDFQAVLRSIKERFAETDQFHLLLDFASMFNKGSARRALVLEAATEIFNNGEIELRDALEKVKNFAPRECSKLFFLLLDHAQNETQRAGALHWFFRSIDGTQDDSES